MSCCVLLIRSSALQATHKEREERTKNDMKENKQENNQLHDTESKVIVDEKDLMDVSAGFYNELPDLHIASKYYVCPKCESINYFPKKSNVCSYCGNEYKLW